MNKRLPARTLYQIQKEHLDKAILLSKSGETIPRFADSTRFDLLHEGRRYPPKAVVALAAESALGKTLIPKDFSGGEGSTAFRLLFDNGYEIATKPATVGTLDATFSVGRNVSTDFLIFESKGPNRNIDYMEGLESLLLSLADYDVLITNISVDSSTTRKMAAKDIKVQPDGYTFPLALRHIQEINELRRAVTSEAAKTARSLDSGSGGNPTKRLRLEFDVPADMTLFELQQVLAGRNILPTSKQPKAFKFTPSKPTQSTDTSKRRGIEPGTVAHVHVAMQQALYTKIIASHGESSVAVECRMASGNPADILVKTSKGYEIYEIKTSLSPRECVRQALGQLLEYAHWPTSATVSKLHIVGPREIDDVTERYISILNQTYGLPLDYVHEPEIEVIRA